MMDALAQMVRGYMAASGWTIGGRYMAIAGWQKMDPEAFGMGLGKALFRSIEDVLRMRWRWGGNDERKKMLKVKIEVLTQMRKREVVVVSSSSLDMFTKSCLGGMMVNLIFLEEVESMEVEEK
uniref:Uncharacterized protein n=1 Tax=Tanacetum cinerariifolium TaxID=118510 RepID=A0A6L2NCD0_TANCI|nr:hypothetical protein [Tanacetum cinerariifolium]